MATGSTNHQRDYRQMSMKILIGWLVISLAACTTPTASFTPTSMPSATASPSATITSSPSPTLTATPTIVPKHFGECPAVQNDLAPDFKAVFEKADVWDFATPVLNFLNQGGSPEAVVQAFEQADERIFTGDLTGDSVPELGVFDPFLNVLGCVNGKYESLLDTGRHWTFGLSEIVSTKDMNLDGIPELVVHNPDSCWTLGSCSETYIYEWDGQQFQNIVENDYSGIISMHGRFDVEVKDIDGNGTQELLTNGGIPNMAAYTDGLPWREQYDTYTWNGKAFVLSLTEFDPSEYRFQAVQDGDRASLRGDYKKALQYYKQAISTGNLGWWTPERRLYEKSQDPLFGGTEGTPLPRPVPDPAERPHLAAYAQYRVTLLYVVQGMTAEAQQAYETLQKKFPESRPGHLYAEMAAEFWMEYQSTVNISQACKKAIEYAQMHQPESLLYLGNTEENYYHGWQSLDYQPKDVCPFSN